MTNQYQSFCNSLSEKIFHIINTQGNLLTWQKGWDDNLGSCLLPIGANGSYHGQLIA